MTQRIALFMHHIANSVRLATKCFPFVEQIVLLALLFVVAGFLFCVAIVSGMDCRGVGWVVSIVGWAKPVLSKVEGRSVPNK
jgi:hypothetical protein